LPARVERYCQQCAQLFMALRHEVRVGKAKYCSHACQFAAYRKYNGVVYERSCLQCGQQFTISAARAQRNRGRYCSPTCARAASRMTDARFWARVARGAETECWPWQAHCGHFGHGQLVVQGAHYKAHRFAYALTYGAIPDGLCVLHRCDNPPCCNPAHLFLGTNADNVADRQAKQRHARGDNAGPRLHPEAVERGMQRYNARLTDGIVREIRHLAAQKQMTQKAIAHRFGVSPQLVTEVVKRRTWKHVE
jgi:hypothetical protein